MAWLDRFLRRGRRRDDGLVLEPPSGSYAATISLANKTWRELASKADLSAESQLVKSILERPNRSSRSSSSGVPIMGVPDLGFKGARQQLFQRYHLLDLYAIAYNNNVLQTARGNLKQEVFRRGLKWEEKFTYRDRRTGKEYSEDEYQELLEDDSKKEKVVPNLVLPNEFQRLKFEEFMECVNVYGQTLLTLLHTLEDDLNIADDAFLFLSSEYTYHQARDSETVQRRVKQLYRLDPAFIEFDADEENRPGFAHHLCLLHRDQVLSIPSGENWHLDWKGVCPIDGHPTFPVFYRYTPRKGTFGVSVGIAQPDPQSLYLVKGEVIHVSKFSPSELYGYSPVLSIYEKALSLIGMDRYLYDYFFERQIPQGVVTTITDNPEDLETRKEQVLAETLNNPHYIPWLAVSSKTGQGRTEFVRFAYSLDELQFLPVQEHIERSVSALYGVPDLFMGASEGTGGLNNETQQLTRMSRGARLSQSVHNTILQQILKACGVTDWTLELENAEETTEEFEINLKQRKAQWAQTLVTMGFGAKYNQDTDEYEITGEVPSQVDQQEAAQMGGMGMGGGGMGGGGMGMSGGADMGGGGMEMGGAEPGVESGGVGPPEEEGGEGDSLSLSDLYRDMPQGVF